METLQVDESLLSSHRMKIWSITQCISFHSLRFFNIAVLLDSALHAANICDLHKRLQRLEYWVTYTCIEKPCQYSHWYDANECKQMSPYPEQTLLQLIFYFLNGLQYMIARNLRAMERQKDVQAGHPIPIGCACRVLSFRFEGGELASGLPLLEAFIHPCVASCACCAASARSWHTKVISVVSGGSSQMCAFKIFLSTRDSSEA